MPAWSPARSALFVVDFQDKLFSVMPTERRDQARAHVENLCFLARELHVPIVASEQYPKGLGPSLPSLGLVDVLPKTTFSAMRTEAIASAVNATGRRSFVVLGMETHICVAQTVLDLLSLGHEVAVVADACLSRRELDWSVSLGRLGREGADVVTAESILFEWLERAEGPAFKEVSRRIR